MAQGELSAKRAPRREVLDILREGDWGEVNYRHRLSCGHTVLKKRASKAIVLACVGCLKAKEFSRGVMPKPYTETDDSALYAAEITHSKMQTGLASLLGISAESVDIVVNSNGDVRYGLIFVSASDIVRLVG